jgi:transposase-like protein
VFPLTTVQTCIIHLIRNSLVLRVVEGPQLVMPDLKAISRAETAKGRRRTRHFRGRMGQAISGNRPGVAAPWEHVVPLFAFRRRSGK